MVKRMFESERAPFESKCEDSRVEGARGGWIWRLHVAWSSRDYRRGVARRHRYRHPSRPYSTSRVVRFRTWTGIHRDSSPGFRSRRFESTACGVVKIGSKRSCCAHPNAAPSTRFVWGNRSAKDAIFMRSSGRSVWIALRGPVQKWKTAYPW